MAKTFAYWLWWFFLLQLPLASDAYVLLWPWFLLMSLFALVLVSAAFLFLVDAACLITIDELRFNPKCRGLSRRVVTRMALSAADMLAWSFSMLPANIVYACGWDNALGFAILGIEFFSICCPGAAQVVFRCALVAMACQIHVSAWLCGGISASLAALCAYSLVNPLAPSTSATAFVCVLGGVSGWLFPSFPATQDSPRGIKRLLDEWEPEAITRMIVQRRAIPIVMDVVEKSKSMVEEVEALQTRLTASIVPWSTAPAPELVAPPLI